MGFPRNFTEGVRRHAQIQLRLNFFKFSVFETPFCVWDWDLRERNLDFLDGIDPRYFVHVADVHSKELDGSNGQHAAVAIRIAYSQALETFFAFLAAAIQAPAFPLGWILRYQMKDLRSVVERIDREGLRYSAFDLPVTWTNVSETINHFEFDDPAKDAEIKKAFARLWRQFAADFLDDKASDEYNSLKHGLRARPGGFSLSIGVESTPGVAAPPEAMTPPQGSRFGSSYFTTEWLGMPKVNFRARRASRNWDPANLQEGLRLLALSTNNVVQFLKIVGGRKGSEVLFDVPDNIDDFEAPWKVNVVFTSASFDSTLTERHIRPFSKEEILTSLERTPPPEKA